MTATFSETMRPPKRASVIAVGHRPMVPGSDRHVEEIYVAGQADRSGRQTRTRRSRRRRGQTN
jgi:hypothetical protein